MLETKRIFLFKGPETIVQKTLAQICGFKAITILEGKFAKSDLEKIFSNNKSIVCTSLDDSLYVADLINISVVDCDHFVFSYKNMNVINLKGNVILQFMEIAQEAGVDIGDHKSNVSDEAYNQRNCIFCKLIAGKPVHYQQVVYESDHFLVVPGSGAFIDGYLMILPKNHVMSCADLSDVGRTELLEVVEDMKYILKQIYNQDILVWENGSGTSGKGKPKTSIVHAHVHMCPSEMDPIFTMQHTGISLESISYAELPAYKSNSYLLVQNYNSSWYIMSDENVYIPRQYVRQLLAFNLKFNGEIWDWRTFPFWDNVQQTADKVCDFVIHYYNELSKRIQDRTKQHLGK